MLLSESRFLRILRRKWKSEQSKQLSIGKKEKQKVNIDLTTCTHYNNGDHKVWVNIKYQEIFNCHPFCHDLLLNVNVIKKMPQIYKNIFVHKQ